MYSFSRSSSCLVSPHFLTLRPLRIPDHTSHFFWLVVPFPLFLLHFLLYSWMIENCSVLTLSFSSSIFSLFLPLHVFASDILVCAWQWQDNRPRSHWLFGNFYGPLHPTHALYLLKNGKFEFLFDHRVKTRLPNVYFCVGTMLNLHTGGSFLPLSLPLTLLPTRIDFLQGCSGYQSSPREGESRNWVGEVMRS